MNTTPTTDTERLDALERDAARYRWLRSKVWANGTLGGYEFQFPTYRELPTPASVMRGSVAQHLDAAIDQSLLAKEGE